MTPDPRWLPFIDRLIILVLVLGLIALAHAVALGKVDEHTSYGLGWIVSGLVSYLLGARNARNIDSKIDTKNKPPE